LQRRRARQAREREAAAARKDAEEKNGGGPSASIGSGTATAGSSSELKKKFVDLTNEPPPAFWIDSLATGNLLPRYLATYSTPTQNIVYWDYEPKNWEVCMVA
jgi:hypothetical protein